VGAFPVRHGPGATVSWWLNLRLSRRADHGDDDTHCRPRREHREQQRLIIGILKSDHLHARVGVMNRDTWVALLAASGFSHDDMRRWHAEFERLAPGRHREFLEFLCLPADDIERIRAWALADDD
jgi:hypothetical protein